MFFRFLGGGGGGIPPDRPRINTGELGRSGRKFPVHGVQDQGDEESETFCTFAHRKCLLTYIDIVGNKTKMCSEKHKHYARAVVRRNRKFSHRRRPLPGGAVRPNFNQLEMVTIFTYRPRWRSMHAISSDRGKRPRNKHTHKQTDMTDYNTLWYGMVY